MNNNLQVNCTPGYEVYFQQTFHKTGLETAKNVFATRFQNISEISDAYAFLGSQIIVSNSQFTALSNDTIKFTGIIKPEFGVNFNSNLGRTSAQGIMPLEIEITFNSDSTENSYEAFCSVSLFRLSDFSLENNILSFNYIIDYNIIILKSTLRIIL